MKYEELKNRQAKDYNELPLFFAFSNNQFNEEMLRLGLTPEDKDKIVSLGAGTFIKKTDRHLVKDLFKKHTEELAEAREDVQYLYDMFLYELGNHEFCITYDVTDEGIKGGITDIVTAAGDLTTFLYDGTDWIVISRMDISDDLN